MQSDSIIHLLAPDRIVRQGIALSRAQPTVTPRANVPITYLVDYAALEPQGVVLPLELIFTTPSTVERQTYTLTAPTAIVVTPREGGPHQVLLREVGHNRWQGKALLQVQGEQLQRWRSTRRRFQ